MKKRGIFVGAIFGAFFAVLNATTIINPAYAAERIFKITDAVISDKSAQTEASISSFADASAANDIIFHNVGEYVEYTFTFKNTDTESRNVLSINVSAQNGYLSYKYNSAINSVIAPDSSFNFILKAIYGNEIESPSLAQQQFNTAIKITYENNEGQPTEQTITITPDPEPEPEPSPAPAPTPNPNPVPAPKQEEEPTAVPAEIKPVAKTEEAKSNNPSTDSDEQIIKVAIIIFIASAATLIVFICYKKNHKIAATIVTVAAISLSFAALSVGATSTTDDEFELENNVTFTYNECQGVCYYANNSEAKGAMANQSATAGQSIALYASNFSLNNHGFAGWNTKANGTGTMYGPNQTIIMPEGDTLKLYATWIESAGDMVGFACDDLQIGDITALNDTDGQTYAVAKLADGNCWTIENSRKITATSANENTAEGRADEPAEDGTIYAYGNYYDGNDARDGEICPTGWRLPSGGSDGDYRILESALDPTETQTEAEQVATWTSYPNNFVYSGIYAPGYGALLGTGTDYIYRGGIGYYYGSDALYDHGNSSYNIYATLLMRSGYMDMGATFMAGQNMGSSSDAFLAARCVIGQAYAEEKTFTLNYDANGGDSAPEAQTATAQGVSYSFTITDEKPTRNHYHLYAWVEEENKDKDITQEYIYEDERFHASDTIIVSNTKTLYAIWEENCTNIHYLPNSEAAEGEMPVQKVCPPKQSATLTAPNFSLAGNGYIGWNTKADGTGTMYGPNEYITVPDEDDVYLYAQWQPAELNVTMQSFNGNTEPYASAPQNTVIALRDERDNNVYAVAKLADGNWWMTENLRLDLNNPNVTINDTNTNNPTQNFISEYNLMFHGNAENTMADCHTLGAECEDRISFSTADINRDNPASYNDNQNVTSWYGYGAHYNWYTATAGNGKHNSNTEYAGGDICPANWHIPTGRNGGEASSLDTAMGGNGENNMSHNIANHWLSYPVNFVLGGSYLDDDTGSSRGTQGKAWTGSDKPEMLQYEQGLTIILDDAGDAWFGNSQSTTNKHYALSVRCLAGQYQAPEP